MFLLRTAFWLTIVILILPADKNASDSSSSEQTSYRLSAGNLFNAARETVSDMSNICERNPEVCETGQAAMHTFGEKARYGAKMVMDFVSEQDISVSEPAEPFQASPAAASPAETSQNTLNSGDLEPTWVGPFDGDRA